MGNEETLTILYDRDIREPMFFFLEEEYGKVRFFEEKVIAKSRADVVMVTEDALVGLEIKSDADTYVRLAGQVKDYQKFFDYNYVVTGTTHAQHIFEHVPDSWGIITVEIVNNKPDFYILRRPQRNSKRSMKRKMSFLWRSELDHIKRKKLKYKYKDKSKEYIVQKLIEAVSEDELDRMVSKELFERDYTKLKSRW